MSAKIMPMPNLSLSESSSTDQTARGDQRSDNNASGYRSSVLNNFALGGSSLDANASASSSSMPAWVWYVVAALSVGAGIWYVMKKGKA
jgi:hypothetical protein